MGLNDETKKEDVLNEWKLAMGSALLAIIAYVPGYLLIGDMRLQYDFYMTGALICMSMLIMRKTKWIYQ